MIIRWMVLGLAILLAVLAVSLWPEVEPSLENVRANQSVTQTADYGHARVIFPQTSVTVVIPQTPALQAKGLSGRTGLSDSEGMLWVYPEAGRYTFWMKDMLIPIDFIWMRDQSVVEITPDVQPPATDEPLKIYRPELLVTSVLEVPAGWAARNSVLVGDVVEIKNQ